MMDFSDIINTLVVVVVGFFLLLTVAVCILLGLVTQPDEIECVQVPKVVQVKPTTYILVCEGFDVRD